MDDNTIVLRSEHDEAIHTLDNGYKILFEKKCELRQRAAVDGDSCRSIVASAMNDFPEDLQPALSMPMAARIVRAKHRTRLQDRFKSLRFQGSFQFADSWFVRSDSDPYILFNEDTVQRGAIIIVTTGLLLDELLVAERWAADGTFYTAPHGFKQVYIINCFKRNRRLACAWVFMQKSTRLAYRSVFNQFSSAVVVACMFDFEKAARDGWTDVFPNGTATGGFFYLEQSIKVHARNGPKAEKNSTTYRRLYSSDAFYRRVSRKLAGLAFVPIPLVKQGFQIIVEEVTEEGGDMSPGSPQSCYRALLKYFQQYYVGLDGILAEEPLFPIPLWNLSERLSAEEEISNAGLESGNARLRALVAIKNPEFCKLVQKLAIVEMPHFRAIRRELLVGNAKTPEHGVAKWARFHSNVRSIILDLNSDRMTLKEFLHAVSGQITVVTDVL